MIVSCETAVAAQLAAHRDRAWPAEACGLLLGVRRERSVAITAYFPTPNVAPEPRRGFAITPQAFLEAERAARAVAAIVVGVFHTHPRGVGRPSAADVAAAWHEHVQLIGTGARDHRLGLTAWLRDGARRLAQVRVAFSASFQR